jgi:cyclic beta-1,2-glucan synthetase
MFDNLSRSLISPCLLGLMLCGWALLGDLAWASTLVVAALPGLPILFEMFATLRRGTWRWGTISTTLAGKAYIIRDELIRWLLTLTFLPYQALLAVDAILRTLFRVLFTRKHLLEWTSSAQIARSFGSGLGLRNTVTQMSPVIIFALSVGTAVWLWSSASLLVALPLLVVGRAAGEPACRTAERDRGGEIASTGTANLAFFRSIRRTGEPVASTR